MNRSTAENILQRTQQLREKRSDGLADQLAAQIQQEALKDVGRVGLMGLGVGGAVRGAQGLYSLLSRAVDPPKETRHLSFLPVPIPVTKQEELQKAAAITDKSQVPWLYGGKMLAGLAGLYGGWKGIDAVLGARQQADLDAQLQDARNEFTTALVSQHRRPAAPGEKVAADELTEIWQQLEKRGLSNTIGTLLNMYGAYAVPAAALTAVAGYKMGTKRTSESVLEKALRQRAAKRQAVWPAEMYATPVPVTSNGEPEMANDRP